MVIALHSSRQSLNTHLILLEILLTVLFIANGGFFTLSGFFLLEKELHTWPEYRKFFLKRIISILVPFVLLNLTMDLLFNRSLYLAGFQAYMQTYFWNVLEYNSAGHLWFMYAYIPMAFCAPFYAKMLNHMSKKELSIFAGLTIIFIVVKELIILAGHSFVFSGYIVTLGSWTVYFLMGYYLQRFHEEIRKWRYLIYIAGIGCFLYIVIKCSVFQLIPGTLLEKPYYMFFIFSALSFLTHSVPVEKLPRVSRFLSFIAKHSLTVYLTHIYIIPIVSGWMENLFTFFRFTPPLMIKEVIGFLFNAVLSIAFAILYDEIFLFRIQSLLKKLCRRWLETEKASLGNKPIE